MNDNPNYDFGGYGGGASVLKSPDFCGYEGDWKYLDFCGYDGGCDYCCGYGCDHCCDYDCDYACDYDYGCGG